MRFSNLAFILLQIAVTSYSSRLCQRIKTMKFSYFRRYQKLSLGVTNSKKKMWMKTQIFCDVRLCGW